MALLIGVDAGTTITKAVAYDDAGRVRASASRPTTLIQIGAERYEQDQEEVFASVVDVITDVVANLGEAAAEVAALGITAQGDGLWLTNADGTPTCRAISWMDGRASDVVDRWDHDGTTSILFAGTGSAPFPGATPVLLAWLATHESAILDSSATAGHCKDMLVARLTGIRRIDPSNAVLFDHASRAYNPALLEAGGLADYQRLLAPLDPHPQGRLGVEPAARIGLPAGIPVVAAPYDLVAAATGAGVEQIGDGLLIAGTTLACQVVRENGSTDDIEAGLTLATENGGRCLRAMPAMIGAATLDWALALVGRTIDDVPDLLRERPATLVRTLPFLSAAGERAPFRDHRARGRIDGITLDTTAADLIRSVINALAYGARSCLQAAGLRGRVVGCGGGMRGPLAQVIADVLGQPVLRCTESEVGALGAAIHAARAMNLVPPPASPVDPVPPDADARAAYQEGFTTYLADVAAARSQWGERLQVRSAAC